MKYCSSLLQKFITIKDSPDNIAKQFILKACEIEEIEERKIPETVVIGKVISCEKHPDADKLSVCQVDCGKKGTFQILCGGSNVKADIFVPVALAGTHFAKMGITIEPRKMRGLESNGMICSKEELGINEDLDLHGIWILTEDLDDISESDLGTVLVKKFPRLDGFVMEVDNKSITNRPDLTGHRGAATELNACYTDKDISFTTIKKRYEQCSNGKIQEVLDGSTASKRKVKSQTDGLNTYILLELNDITVKTSSFFTRLQMLDIGSTPRNNRVDFSNLFMNIVGQPVHFFDAAKVDGDIIVRNAKKKETFTDLFGTTHELIESDVVIADNKKVLALAGIVGGLESGITEDTKDILVEIANFDPVVVRKTGTRLSLRTDAELRYEKNINPLRSLYCLLFFLDELKYYQKDLGKFEIGGLSYYISGNVEKSKSGKVIDVDISKMEQFIFGKEIKDFEKIAKNILTRLGFTYNVKRGTLSVVPPIWRSPDDINIPEDMYEEVARIYGYDAIETLPLIAEVKHIDYTPFVALTRKLEDILVRNLHLYQIETYPRIGEKTISLFRIEEKTLYRTLNPVNPELPYLRDNIMYGLINHVVKNHKFFDTFGIFDIGKIWKKIENGKLKMEKGKENDEKFAKNFVGETTELGILIYQKDIHSRDKDPFLQGKSMVRELLKQLGIMGEIGFANKELAIFHPKKQIEITCGKTTLGTLGSVHPLLLQAMKVPEQAGVVSITLSLDALVKVLEKDVDHHYSYETLQDQIIRRDICFVVDAHKEFGPVLEAVRTVNEVRDLEVFDVYQGTNLPEGKKSVAFRIKIVGDGTMTSEQINEVMNKAIKAGEKAGGKLRG